MRFELDLSPIKEPLEIEIDEDADSITDILFEFTSSLEASGKARFQVGGFGEDPWPTDNRDLSIFLEAIPKVIASIDSRTPFSIAFPEQGLLRFIRFTPRGPKDLAGECVNMSGGGWEPNPSVEVIGAGELRDMLTRIQLEVIRFVEKTNAKIAAHPWFLEWARSAYR